ncbi:Pentatricopeptide repeat-containing protein ELI1 [Hibiscus syriacus]|uniref:Pentatricopeptide repeat-containing protein ELI1 n=1 Tax=Hibiscus syriacus TaxID=106335 RepID=A0A6A3AHS7_HIBSY|nr:Pentatricopeptide repeat-containing protein ELI1 [Hibiscus syriacus]
MLHYQVIKLGFDSDLYVKTGLVDVYARRGDVGSARLTFERMPEKSLVSLTTMLTCYAKHWELKEARSLFDGMVKKDVVCWNVMIDGYAQHGMPNEALLGALESGRWLHSYVDNNDIQVNVRLATALIDMYNKCGSLEDARLVFDKISDKDVVGWNSMILGYALHGLSQVALELFNEMLEA